MEFQNTLNDRINVKKYTSKKPPIEKIIEAIQAANQTPGPGNLNVLTYIIVEDLEIISKITEACQQQFINQAPYVIIITSDSKQLKKLYDVRTDKYIKHYAGASLENFSLKLIDLGLASCWIEAFSEPTLRNLLMIPDSQEIELILTIGYEMEKLKPRRKPALINKVFFGKWGNKFHKPFVKVRREDV